MLNGRPLLACRMIPSWLLLISIGPMPLPLFVGAITVDSENVCVWLNGVTPLSRSRFVTIGDPIVLAADDVGAGQRRVVYAARQRVGRLRHPSVSHALA